MGSCSTMTTWRLTMACGPTASSSPSSCSSTEVPVNFRSRGCPPSAPTADLVTRLIPVLADYLYMYACMLPFRVWDLPNQMLNCEDVLMNMVVSVASSSGPHHTFSGIAYQPAHGVQVTPQRASNSGLPVSPLLPSPPLLSSYRSGLMRQDDYGAPPPAELRGKVKVLAGLSGVVNHTGDAWAGTRTGCTNALASFFGALLASEPVAWLPCCCTCLLRSCRILVTRLIPSCRRSEGEGRAAAGRAYLHGDTSVAPDPV